jgi:hypothetical protein
VDQWQDEQGLALIVAVVILLLFAIMAVVMVSLVSTDSDISLYQFRSGEALNIGIGGQQYTMMQTYPNYSRPPYSTRGGTPQVNLGSGGFTVDPPAVLSAGITNAASTIPAVCFDRGNVVNCNTIFPAPGRILIGSELIDYTGVGAGNFTGATRGRDGSLAVAHVIDQGIYHATGLTANVNNAVATIPVGSTVGFTIPGTIKIDQEFLYCTGIVGGFSGCTRGAQGSQAMAHNALATAIQVPVTVKATVATGIVGNAQRILQAQTGVYLDGWMVGDDTGGGTPPEIIRWNGINWDSVAAPPSDDLKSVFLFDTNNDGAADDGWAVGDDMGGGADTLIARWNGTSWAVVDPAGNVDTDLNSVYCVATNDCWAVGDDVGGGADTLIMHWDGVTWSTVDPAGNVDTTLNSVYCVATNDCWAVGDDVGGAADTLILRWNGAIWSVVDPAGNIDTGLNSVYCNATNDCWAAGDAGLILHWDGIAWSQYPSPTGDQLNGVFMVRTQNFVRLADWQEMY